MFAECWTRKLATAYTIPGLPGHDSESTYAWQRAAPIDPASALLIAQLDALYATMMPCRARYGQEVVIVDRNRQILVVTVRDHRPAPQAG